jgi:hypothetical protein
VSFSHKILINCTIFSRFNSCKISDSEYLTFAILIIAVIYVWFTWNSIYRSLGLIGAENKKSTNEEKSTSETNSNNNSNNNSNHCDIHTFQMNDQISFPVLSIAGDNNSTKTTIANDHRITHLTLAFHQKYFAQSPHFIVRSPACIHLLSSHMQQSAIH